jgi:hypothetical protein
MVVKRDGRAPGAELDELAVCGAAAEPLAAHPAIAAVADTKASIIAAVRLMGLYRATAGAATRAEPGQGRPGAGRRDGRY